MSIVDEYSKKPTKQCKNAKAKQKREKNEKNDYKSDERPYFSHNWSIALFLLVSYTKIPGFPLVNPIEYDKHK